MMSLIRDITVIPEVEGDDDYQDNTGSMKSLGISTLFDRNQRLHAEKTRFLALLGEHVHHGERVFTGDAQVDLRVTEADTISVTECGQRLAARYASREIRVSRIVGRCVAQAMEVRYRRASDGSWMLEPWKGARFTICDERTEKEEEIDLSETDIQEIERFCEHALRTPQDER